jgi:hypothetical protein
MLLAGTLVALALAQGPACIGEERWPVKTLTDNQAAAVDLEKSHVTVTTVEHVATFTAPKYHEVGPRAPEEKQVFSIVGDVVGFKLEKDQDYHVILRGDSGQTMVIEFPRPECAKGSRVLNSITRARNTFLKHFVEPRVEFVAYRKKPVKVKVTGIGFFDKLHGQKGMLPNGFELHPILALEPAE